MPYISPLRRNPLAEGAAPRTVGELNFLLTKACLSYLFYNGVSYDTLADIEAACGHVAKELYRRITAKYEDQKIIDNTDLEGFADLGYGAPSNPSS